MTGPRHRRRPPRRGFTLIELLVASTAATVLLMGLATSIYLSGQSMQPNTVSYQRADAATVQADMLSDMQTAIRFTTRTATAATFTVPDRDGDSNTETLDYQWSGSPTNQLTLAVNGGAPAVLLDGVTDFSFAWSQRSVTGAAPTPPTMDPNTWGNRWATSGSSDVGYDHVFSLPTTTRRTMRGSKVTLTEAGTFTSVTVYLTGGNSDIEFAIYDVDGSGDPKNLLAHTATHDFDSSEAGWVTLDIGPVAVTAGDYVLFLSHKSASALYHKTTAADFITYPEIAGIYSGTWKSYSKSTNPLKLGWPTTLGTVQKHNDYFISIYATYTPD